jgi:hypothetical protein
VKLSDTKNINDFDNKILEQKFGDFNKITIFAQPRNDF